MSPSPRCAVFISGRGTNLQVLLSQRPKFNVALVVSNSDQAEGLVRAREANVETLVLDKKVDWDLLHHSLKDKNIQGLFLAGFMKILPSPFVLKWVGRIFNIHPSLLPKFKGLHAVKQAYLSNSDVGASIHRVVPEVDSGEALKQSISVLGDQVSSLTLDEVEALNLKNEHQLLEKWVEEQWPKVLM